MVANSRFAKFMQRTALLAALLIAPLVLNASSAFADTTVVMLVNIEPGKSKEEALGAMKSMVDVIGKQPNLVSQEFLQSSFKDNNPAYVHIMKWKDLSDWEKLSADPAFQDLLTKNAPYFVVKPAEVFVPVK
jgi:hypothetical protein